jgi:protein-S-isoprenylcysteine O-methyltransferase Ste14
MKANVITFVVIVGMTVWLAMHVGMVTWTPVKMVGGVMAAVGVALLMAARVQLGASFSVRAKAKKLVTRGCTRGFGTRFMCSARCFWWGW